MVNDIHFLEAWGPFDIRTVYAQFTPNRKTAGEMCYNALVDTILVWKTGGTKSMRKARKRWAPILIGALIDGIVPVGTAAGSVQAESGGTKESFPGEHGNGKPTKIRRLFPTGHEGGQSGRSCVWSENCEK